MVCCGAFVEMSAEQQVGLSLRLERFLLVIGLALLTFWGAAWLHRVVLSHAALTKFYANTADTSVSVAQLLRDPATGSPVDFSLWSVKRIAAFKDSLTVSTKSPLAILRVSKIHLEVPVFEDTDDFTLNRGLGRIHGTAQIGQSGNVGLAGHRDGFFRGLKDVVAGDQIELVRPEQTDIYVITKIQIVSPDDVSVLAPTPAPTLTLVTCFPFYFIGNAPQRYIVTASLTSSGQTNKSASVNSNPYGKKNSDQEIKK
jgi:sortase A